MRDIAEAGERRNLEARGRGASSPSDIPAKGWKDILWRVYNNISEHRVVSIAAGVTFFVLLAIFPAVAALVAINGLVADPSTIGQHLNDFFVGHAGRMRVWTRAEHRARMQCGADLTAAAKLLHQADAANQQRANANARCRNHHTQRS